MFCSIGRWFDLDYEFGGELSCSRLSLTLVNGVASASSLVSKRHIITFLGLACIFVCNEIGGISSSLRSGLSISSPKIVFFDCLESRTGTKEPSSYFSACSLRLIIRFFVRGDLRVELVNLKCDI